MLTLYYRPGACALGPHIVLEWLHRPFETVNAPRDDTYKAINPTGAVPVLRLADGALLTQCAAVLQYLAEDAGRTDLLGGEEPKARAEVTRWTAFLTGDFHPAFFPVFVPQRFTTAGEEALDPIREAGRGLVRAGLDRIDDRLAASEWLAGPNMTVADAYAVPMLRWSARLFHGLDEWPATARLYTRMLKDEGVSAAMHAQGIEG